MKVTKDLNKFMGYDLVLAKCHIENWGVVYLDEYNVPMEVEDVVYI